MDNSLQVHGLLLLRHEVLRARLGIRDFFLKNTVKEVYENIGQVLSLVRMQLALLDSDTKLALENIEPPGNLVGQSIKDLRIMCKSFYPDTDILNEEGFIEALRDTVRIIFQAANPIISTKGIQKDILPELKLVVFKMIQEILILIKEIEAAFVSLAIAYREQEVEFTILYKGEEICFTNNVDNTNLTLHERAQLVEGYLNLTKRRNGLMQVQLCHPLKCLLYGQQYKNCFS